MYQWVKLLHLLGVAGLLLAHGASVAVTFALRKEREPARINALLELSSASIGAFYASLGTLITAGVILGFMGPWWERGWIWASIGMLIAVTVAMYVLARTYYRRIRKVMAIQASGSHAVGPQEIERVMASGRPMLIAGIGLGGLLVIFYLMVIKPF